MPFQDFEIPEFPPRHWGLMSYPGDGKSTFSTQMRGPLLPIDADHRYAEVAALAGKVLKLSNVPADHNDTDRIAALLNREMPGSQVGTIVIDSATAIIAPLVTQAMQDKERGRLKNLYAGFRDKAQAMRQLQDAVTKWGTDTLWIYHLNDARDGNGAEVTRATLSATEVLRLTRSLNMQLQIVREDARRGVKVVWARSGRSGNQVGVLWDESGKWIGMPEKIEQAVYGGLTKEDMDKIETSAPEFFPTPEAAMDWAIEQGAFDSIQHARNAYDKIKREANPQNARHMAALWTADVERRKNEKVGGAGR